MRLLLPIALLFAGLSRADSVTGIGTGPIHVPNFGEVNKHLYRGGQPGFVGLKDLSSFHIVLDIDLREPGEGTESERRVAEGLGIKYINIPFRSWGAPAPEQVSRVLALITQDDSGRTFIHCRRGKDRTGTVIACYRIQHDGWKNTEAAKEADRYGMSRAERAMRSFIQRYQPTELPVPALPEE